MSLDNESRWTLEHTEGGFFVALPCECGPESAVEIEAFFESTTGNVYACGLQASGELLRASKPCVRMLDGIDGDNGQVLVLQQDGSYRRMARWDKLAPGAAKRAGAVLRTLPQCGCGGSLGVPKLFESFAELGAYYYCAFVHSGAL